MAEKQQDEDTQDPEEAMTSQQQEGVNVLKAIIDPINDNISALGNMIASNTKLIQQMAKNPPKQEPLIPPELAKLLPDLVKGIIGIFTQPDTPAAAASKGIFDEAMMTAYKKSTIAIWDMNAKMTQANLDSINLENALRKKRLTEEF